MNNPPTTLNLDAFLPPVDPAPAFGHPLRPYWPLENETVFLNHGSYGATPWAVLAAQDHWRQQMERQPLRFFGTELPPALRAAADELARFLNGRGDDLVFVDNATTGANTVFQALTWREGDELLVTTHGYGAVRKAAVHLCRRTGARLVEADVPFPLTGDAQVIETVTAAITPRTRLAVFDHITSPTALILPVAELTAACRQRGVRVLIDGAHGPGLLPVDLARINADYYTGNCHKWLCSAKGCGFLWAAPPRQAELHPLVISHGYEQGFLKEFDWTGTQDPSAWLSVSAALIFHRRLGPERVHAYANGLALRAGRMLADALGTTLPAPPAMLGPMVTIELPGPWNGTDEEAAALHDRLLAEHRIEVPFIPFNRKLWVRISAQVYNEMPDFERLRDALHAELPRVAGASCS